MRNTEDNDDEDDDGGEDGDQDEDDDDEDEQLVFHTAYPLLALVDKEGVLGFDIL